MTNKERIQNLENSLAFYRGAFFVGAISLALFFGVTSLIQIPLQIKSAVENQISTETTDKIKSAKEKAEEFLSINTSEKLNLISSITDVKNFTKKGKTIETADKGFFQDENCTVGLIQSSIVRAGNTKNEYQAAICTCLEQSQYGKSKTTHGWYCFH